MTTKAATLKAGFILCISCVLLFDSVVCDIPQLQTHEFFQFISDSSLVVVLFKSANECPSCSKALEYLEQAPQPELLQTVVVEKRFVTDDNIADKFGATNYPAIVYFRNRLPVLYNGQLSSTEDIPEFVEWLVTAAQVALKDLTDDSFEHLTQTSTGATTGDWFVYFYSQECGDCLKKIPAVESAAVRLKHKMNFAKVDMDTNKKLVERFKISKSPTGILFKQGKMYMYEPEKYDSQSLVSFVESWYINVKAVPVPKQPTAFDVLTESIAMYIKQQVNDPNSKWMVILAVAAMCLIILITVLFLFRKPSGNRQKYD